MSSHLARRARAAAVVAALALVPTLPISSPAGAAPSLAACSDPDGVVERFALTSTPSGSPSALKYSWSVPDCAEPLTSWSLVVDGAVVDQQTASDPQAAWQGTTSIPSLAPGSTHELVLEARGATTQLRRTATFRVPVQPVPTPVVLGFGDCQSPPAGSSRVDSRITVNTNADGSRVSLSWTPAGPVGPNGQLCTADPTTWDVFIDGMHVDQVYGRFGATYEAIGLPVGSTHTFKVVPAAGSLDTLRRTFTITPGYTDPPVGQDPTPTPPPTPTPTVPPTPTPGPILCVDPGPNAPQPLPIGPKPANLRQVIGFQPVLGVAWDVPYGCYSPAVRYEVTVTGGPSGTLTATKPASDRTAFFSGLPVGQEVTVSVVAIDASGARSEPAQITARNTYVVDDYFPSLDAKVSGAAVLRTSTPGAISLAGDANLSLNQPNGSLSGTLKLATGKLTLRAVSGLIPITGSVVFGGGDAAVGSFVNRTITLTASRTLTFRSVKVLGIDLLAGKSCSTVAPATISVKSAAGAVDGTSTNPITTTGTLTLPKTSGCGFLGTLIAPTSKPNTVSLTVTPNRPIVRPTQLPAS